MKDPLERSTEAHRIENRYVCPSAEDISEFPGKIMCIIHASIHTLA